MRNGFPVAGRGMVLGLPGGSFDPAHEGHVHITHEAIKRLGLGRESGMRVIWVIAAVMWAGAALAEDVVVTQEGNTTYVTVVGNLAPTQDPGCKGLAYSEDDLSPPDLFLGVIDCLGKGRGESAAGMAILMLARTAYDTKRVTDQTAHDAGQVLMMQMRQSLLTEKQELLDAQMKRMTEPGSPAFQNVCLALVFKGPPTHSPYYMISHGIKAITGDGGLPLVEPFDAKAAWDAVRKDYLHCPF